MEVSGKWWMHDAEGEMKRTEEVVEQFAAVFVRVKAIVNVWLEPRVDVSVVEFTIQDQENRVFGSRVI